jgi:hypothetical protein
MLDWFEGLEEAYICIAGRGTTTSVLRMRKSDGIKQYSSLGCCGILVKYYEWEVSEQ